MKMNSGVIPKEKKMFKKILIANRGEIALRIIRTCKEMGIKTVAVYSTVDRDSLHVRFADEAVCIGPPASRDSYLNIPNLISAAELTNADAIHPGYGFLSENAKFSAICAEYGIKFIGATADQINAMGDKASAKATMKKAGVPTIPGSEGLLQDVKEGIAVANKIGYPVILKATAGGGGRGMRLVWKDEEFEPAWDSARAESAAAFGNDGIYAVNTSFSCICKVNGNYNFIPFWQPSFITDLATEDRCHLNGLVIQNGAPKYVSALSATNTPQGWRDSITTGGILMDVENNEIILQGLAMPHSPRMYNNELYMLLSASGEFIKVNTKDKSYTVIKKFDGFCRGLDFCGEYAFIAFSKLRKNSSTFAKLSFSDKANFAGVKIIHIPTKAQVAEITYQNSVDEIYELSVLANTVRPNILNTINEIHKHSLAIPGHTFWANPDSNVF